MKVKGARNNKTIKKIILPFAFIVLSTGSVFSSYFYGFTKGKNKFYAAEMSLDYLTKKQTHTDFLHGSLTYVSEINKVSEYQSYLDFQRKTKNNYYYYNSFLVSSFDGEFIDYCVNFSDSMEQNRSKLLQLATYYDYDYLESVGLPLFKFSDGASTINPKNGAQLGAYISATQAEKIVFNNGMLESCNNDLNEAFAKLIQDKTYKFTISNELNDLKEIITVSVNGIYLDYEHLYMLNDFQNSVQQSRYGNYSKTFDFWFKNSIFTFSYQLFSKGCSYVFDIRKNYGNIDRFFSVVTGYDYANKGISMLLFAENGEIYNESHVLNNASLEYYKNSHFLYLFPSIICFVLLAIVFDIFYNQMSKKCVLLLSATPFIIFAITQIIFNLMLAFITKKYVLYNIFNPTGNVIFLISSSLLLLNNFIWSKYVKTIKK